jgi:hypothetical protein
MTLPGFTAETSLYKASDCEVLSTASCIASGPPTSHRSEASLRCGGHFVGGSLSPPCYYSMAVQR